MFEILNALSHENRELWLKRQRRGKLPFVLLWTLSMGGNFFVLVSVSPRIIFNRSPSAIFNSSASGIGATLLVACMCFLCGYWWSNAQWRKGLRITSATDAIE